MNFALQNADLLTIVPEITLVAGGVFILLADLFLPKLKKAWVPLSVLVAFTALCGVMKSYLGGATEAFGGILESTEATATLSIIVLISAILSLLASQAYLKREGILGGEYPALILWCTAGVTLMLRSTELLTLFVALELFSICLYVLAAYHRKLANSVESALKYFMMGAFVSAFILLGIALLYGETGSTSLADIATTFRSPGAISPLATLGVLLLFCGFGFKMSIVPFHAWSPDAYSGAPSPFVGYLSVAPKAASALVLFRVLELTLGAPEFAQVVTALSILSMVFGNLFALVQKDIKRMLAYSGIAHMGYLLIPLASLGEQSLRPMMIYLFAYALMNAGAFTVVALLYTRPGEQHLVSELSGWGYRFPLLGACLMICMLSLGGIPPTFGFLGKYSVFLHAVDHGQKLLAVVGIISALIGVFYYLRVVYVLYMKSECTEPEGVQVDFWGRSAAILAAGGSLLLGLWPGLVFSLIG